MRMRPDLYIVYASARQKQIVIIIIGRCIIIKNNNNNNNKRIIRHYYVRDATKGVLCDEEAMYGVAKSMKRRGVVRPPSPHRART